MRTRLLNPKRLLCEKIQRSYLPAIFLLSFLFIGMTSLAQQLSENARQQMQALIEEKASRTPAQKKISSDLLYSSRMSAGLPIARGVTTLRNAVKKEADGRVKVDITGTVTPRLLAAIRNAGGEIIFSSERFRSVTAKLPLKALESVAELDDVRGITTWMEPMNNRTYGNPGDGKKPTAPSTANFDFFNSISSPKNNNAAFAARADNVRKAINLAMSNKKVAAPYFAGSVTSEADATHKAALARTIFGVNGAGVKIGVLSDGVTGYATSQASGDLPATITILPGQAGSGSEGRAMMELIYDLAPGADLYFATAFTSSASFAQNIIDLRTAGCDIIVDDITYFAEGVFQDDNIAQAVNSVTASGALYFSSAGNSGNKNDGTAGVWEGDFVDGGSSAAPFPLTGNFHLFSAGTPYNVITANTGNVTLKWSDPLGLSGNDYDLFVTNAAGTAIAVAGTSVQDGNDNPYEQIGSCFAGERLYILKKTAAAPRALHLNTNRGMITFNTPGVVYGHNAGLNTISVAATPASVPNSRPNSTTGPFPFPHNSNNKVEVFSSDGPRRIFYNPNGTEITPGNLLFGTNGGSVLQKPDLTAADGTLTVTPGFIPFFGTSASAPHVAAIAALVKSASPSSTAAQIKAALIASCIDIETPGVDRDAGAGIVMAVEAIEAAGVTGPAYLIQGTINAIEGSYGNGNGSIDPGELGSMTVQLVNASATAATAVSAVLTSSTPGVTITQDNANYGNIGGHGSATNTATPYLFGVNSSVACGAFINFTLTVTYSGGASPQVFNFTIRAGTPNGIITATFGSPLPSGTNFTAVSGTQNNRLNRNGIIPTCAAPKAVPVLQEGLPGASRAYHAYTFTNTNPVSQCVNVSITSSAVTSIYEVAYGNGGFIPTSIQTNYLADQGTTTNASAFSFNAPAGQQFTVVVHEVNVGGGAGVTYNLNVAFQTCPAPPPCTPVTISTATLADAVYGAPYSQSITATGGSGSYLYSLSGALPSGLTFTGNTISGTTTAIGSYPISVTATDATGCPQGTQNYTLNVVCPVITVNASTVTQPTCALPTGTIVVNATAPAGTLEYSVDGGATWSPSNTFSGLAVNTYNIVARITGTTCSQTGTSVTLNAATAPVMNAPTVTQPSCATPTGTIVVNATGTGPLEYSVGGAWQSSNSFGSLAPNTYTVSARLISDNTCSSSTTVVLNAPASCCTITCPGNITVNSNALLCGAFVSYPAANKSAGCGAGAITYSKASGTWFPVGTTTVTASFGGNTCSFTVTVKDVTKPILVYPPIDIETLVLGNACSKQVSFVVGALDNCSNVSVVATPASGSTFSVGTTTVNVTATDASGNVSTGSFKVTVREIKAPVITCPSNVTINAVAGQCYGVYTVTTPSASDNCGTATVTGTRDDGKPLNANFPIGQTVITWKAKDASGNTSSCNQRITVKDNQAPIITGLTPSPSVLWPADRSMVNVNVNYGIIENCRMGNCQITVTSNEPISGTGAGDLSPDWQILNSTKVKLRAERRANGTGRIYTIRVTCADDAGNQTIQTTTVSVPLTAPSSTTTTSSAITNSGGAGEAQRNGRLNAVLSAQLLPNPAERYFNLVIAGGTGEAVDVTIYDITGKLIQKISQKSGNRIQFGETLVSGMYMVEVRQGSEKILLKAVKQ